MGSVSAMMWGSPDSTSQKLQAQRMSLSIASLHFFPKCICLLNSPTWLSSEFIPFYSPSRCFCCWEPDSLKRPCVYFFLMGRRRSPLLLCAFVLVLTNPLSVWLIRFFMEKTLFSPHPPSVLMKASKVSEARRPLPGGSGRWKAETVHGSFCPVCSSHKWGADCGADSLSHSLSTISAVSKQLMKLMLRAHAALGFDRYIPQSYCCFKRGMTHGCGGRKPVIMLINAIWRKHLVLLLKCSLWSVLHPQPYLNGSQIKLNASQTNSFHPPLFKLFSLVMLIGLMLSGYSQITTHFFFFFSRIRWHCSWPILRI